MTSLMQIPSYSKELTSISPPPLRVVFRDFSTCRNALKQNTRTRCNDLICPPFGPHLSDYLTSVSQPYIILQNLILCSLSQSHISMN